MNKTQSVTAYQRSDNVPNFNYWFVKDTLSSSDDESTGNMRTIDGTRLITKLKNTAKNKLKQFFSPYEPTNETEGFIIRFLINKLPSILVQSKNTFDSESFLSKKEDWLAARIQHIIPSFIQYAQSSNFNSIDLKDPELVKNQILNVLQEVVLQTTIKTSKEQYTEMPSSSNFTDELPNQQSFTPHGDISYIINVLNKIDVLNNKSSVVPPAQSSLSRFKETIVNLTPDRIGKGLEYSKRFMSVCARIYTRYGSKFMPTHEGIKKFISPYAHYKKPIQGLVAIGGLLFAWYYMPTIPEITRQNIHEIYDKYRLSIGATVGTVLTLAVSRLFNQNKTPTAETKSA